MIKSCLFDSFFCVNSFGIKYDYPSKQSYICTLTQPHYARKRDTFHLHIHPPIAQTTPFGRRIWQITTIARRVTGLELHQSQRGVRNRVPQSIAIRCFGRERSTTTTHF